MSQIETITMPVISTGHLTEEVTRKLTERKYQNLWMPCAAWEYGFFMYPDAIEGSGEAPQCLLDIRDWLSIEGFDGWVRLDAAAARVKVLPFYDW